ncbi:MAG: hypothetical protein LH614_09190 [Pyrinomonadaceae bacterium]|nr:hypothetical protein [Pyrinomonadaceae bacterium]
MSVSTLADAIRSDSSSIASKFADQQAIEDEMQTIKHAALSEVLTARFEINLKLRYTNDDQRKIAVEEMLTDDVNCQGLKVQRSVKVVEQSLLLSEVEYQRRRHKSLATLVLFLANKGV